MALAPALTARSVAAHADRVSLDRRSGNRGDIGLLDAELKVGNELRILILEDSEEDAELICRSLTAGGVEAEYAFACDEASFRQSLTEFVPDAILADFSLPTFNGTEALAIARAWDASVPCLLVSGALGEELAVTAMRSGATDYVLKDRLALLPPALRRALDEATQRRDREILEAEIEQFRRMTSETFERMPLGFVSLDEEMRVTFANPAVLRLGGMDLESVIGRRIADLFPQIIGTKFESKEAEVRAGKTIIYEEWFEPAGMWLEVMACPTTMGITVFVRDVTDRKRAEDAVRESEALMRGSIDAMPDPFLVCSAVRGTDGALLDFRIGLANEAAAAFVGRDVADIVGRTITEVFPASLETNLREGCRRAVETGTTWTDDAYAVGSDGAERLFSIAIAKYRDGFFLVARDVTQREHQRLERERLAAVVEQTTDGVVITDAAGTAMYANPAFLATVGRPRADIVGRPGMPVAAELLDRHQLASMERCATSGKPWLGEVHRSQGDGQVQHLEVGMAPVREPGGTLTGYVVQTRDVTSLREAEQEVDLQKRIRDALSQSLHRIPPEASVEQTAQAICDELVALPFIDQASVDVFIAPTDLRIIGHAAPPGFPLNVGDRLPEERAAIIHRRLQDGPWAWYSTADPSESAWMRATLAAGLKATAYGPIVLRDEVIGALVIGTMDAEFARTIVEKMPGLVSFGATSSALLAERLDSMRHAEALKASLLDTIRNRRFRPVFQPIVDLEEEEAYGYEALTRFASNQPPDRCFADARTVGLGVELELATLEAAVESAAKLPSGRWLNLNVSPGLLESPDRLLPILATATRPIVLEITEHEIVNDYARVRDAVRALPGDVRMAVDDAGAGFANFGHILGLRPDFVKLDISLVRDVNSDLARQALVVGLRHFSRTAGCRLLAEGIETREEAATLAGLGVEFGQGYLFGRPAPAGDWKAGRNDSAGIPSAGIASAGIASAHPAAARPAAARRREAAVARDNATPRLAARQTD